MRKENRHDLFRHPAPSIDLAKRDNLPLRDVRGTMLRVTRGSLWITQENDPRDLVLRTGDTWVVERDGLTIVEAQADIDRLRRWTQRRRGARDAAGHDDARRSPLWRARASRARTASFLTPPARRALPYY